MNNNVNLTFKERIKNAFENKGEKVKIPLQINKTFTAKVTKEGIEVDNLSNYPLLEWEVFDEIEKLFNEKGPSILKGDAMNYKLGESGLPIDSIEGRIAYAVYDKELGDSVFRRISPIVGILVWADICEVENDYLILKE